MRKLNFDYFFNSRSPFPGFTVADEMARAIRLIRWARGLTLAGLSELSGVSASYICRIESGGLVVKKTTIKKLCAGLGVPETALTDTAALSEQDILSMALGEEW